MLFLLIFLFMVVQKHGSSIQGNLSNLRIQFGMILPFFEGVQDGIYKR